MIWISIGFFKTGPISIFSEYLEQAEQQSERSSLDKPISSCEYIVGYLSISKYIRYYRHSPVAAAPVSLLLKKQNQSKQITLSGQLDNQ